MFAHVNLFAVLVGTISNVLLGMLWYSPLLFGKYCPSTMRPGYRPSASEMAGAIAVALVTSWGVAQLIGWTNPLTLVHALIVGFVAWLGLGAAPSYSAVIWMGQDPALWFVNTTGLLVRVAVLCTIFFMWTQV